MISAGNQITRASLDALAALANQKIPNAMPFKFYGPWHILGYSNTAPATIAEATKIQAADIGELAVTNEPWFGASPSYTKVYRLKALPSTDVANWEALPYTSIVSTPFTGTRNVSGGGTFQAIFDLQEWDFAQGHFTGPLGLYGLGLKRQVFYRWNPITAGWMPVGDWIAELSRIRYFAARALTNRNPALTEDQTGGLNMGIKENCRVSGPWPVLPDNADNYLQQSKKEFSGRQLLAPTIFIQSATAGLSAEAGSKGRIICYPKIRYEVVSNQNQFPWIDPGAHIGGGDLLVMRLSIATDQIGKLRGSITFFDPVFPAANIGIQSIRQFNSQESNLPNQIATETPGFITQIYFDTDFAGGDLLCTAGWQPTGGRYQNYTPTGLPVPALNQKQARPRTGTVDIGGPNDHVHPYGSRGAAMRFTLDYDVIPATGLARNRLWKAALTGDVKSNPTDAFVSTPNPLRPDENDADVGYGATLYPVSDPNFPDPLVQGPGDGPGDPAILPFPYVANTNDNITNAVIVAKTKPLLPMNLRASGSQFAPNANPSWLNGPTRINHEILPYPIARHTAATRPVIGGPQPPYGDGNPAHNSVLGMIIEITLTRMPAADGNFPASSAALSCDIGAFGILGHDDTTFTNLQTLQLAANQNHRTWRQQVPADVFEGIVVLSPIPLAYRCTQPLLVQCLFMPTVPLGNYSEALPTNYSAAQIGIFDLRFPPTLKFAGLPVLSPLYNDTEALLNLV